MLTRRGLALVELMVTLSLLGIVCTGVYRVLETSQRTHLAQTQRLDLQQTLRNAVTTLAAELRELSASDGDLTAIGPTSLRIRAPRQVGFLCSPPAVGPPVAGVAPATLTIRENLFFGARDFDSDADSIFVLYEGQGGTASDDDWLRGHLAADPAPLACADGTPGRRLAVRIAFGPNHTAAGAIPNGAPVRGYESVTYSLYRAGDGRWYVGVLSHSAGGARQPLIGPLHGASGISFEYFDAGGAATLVARAVAEIRISVRAETAQPVRWRRGPPAYITDSVTTRVSLRNNRL